MPLFVVTNALIRIDGVTGPPPVPFERPRADKDFFVLELDRCDDVHDWHALTMQTLGTHAQALQRMQSAGAQLTLFVEFGSHVLRFEPPLLRALADAGIALEYSHEDA